MNKTEATACCLCCVAAAERDELDHLVSNECPDQACEYHHPLTPAAVRAARERLYKEVPVWRGGMGVRLTTTGELGITTDVPRRGTSAVPVQLVGRNYPVLCQLAELTPVEVAAQ